MIARRTGLLFGAALLLWGAWRGWSSPTPERLRDRAIAALDHRNVDELLRLTGPDELQRLHVNQENARALLASTIWQANQLRFGKVERIPRPVDEPSWTVEVSGPGTGPRGRLVLSFLRHEKGETTLNLTLLLHSACHVVRPTGGGGPLYRTLARDNGITGIRMFDGVYFTHEEVEAKLAKARGSSH